MNKSHGNGVAHLEHYKNKEKDESYKNKFDTDTINPFVHTLNLDSVYDRIKLGFMSVFVLPIRVIGIIICLLVAYVLSLIGMYGLSNEDLLAKPLTGWRRRIRWCLGFLGRMMMRCYGFQWVTVKGKLASRTEAPILVVGPHTSFFDAVAVFWSYVPGLVNRIENLQLPFFGKFINFTQPVYVWREDPNSRQNTISEIKRRVNSQYDWPQILIFPEGTCTNRSCLITYKPGAFYPGVPIQPVIVRYPNKTDSMTWTWDGPGAVKLLWVTLCQFHNFCEIEYLPVYHPNGEEKKDPFLYAKNVRQVMSDALRIPVKDYSYDDCRIMHKAKLQNLPVETGLIEYQKLKNEIGKLSLVEIEDELMSQYATIAHTQGKISLHDLSDYLLIPKSECLLSKLFNCYDKSQLGVINFRDFIVFRYEIKNYFSTEENLKLVFKSLTENGESQIDCAMFTKALQQFHIDEESCAKIFEKIDKKVEGVFTYDEFCKFCVDFPEYFMFLFLHLKDLSSI